MAAARRFLREHPYRVLTVDALMADAGHHRTLFYRHFDGLPALVLELLRRLALEVSRASRGWPKVSADPEAALRSALAGIVGLLAQEGPLLRAIAEAAHHDAEIAAAYGAHVDMFTAIATQAVAQTTELRDGSGRLDAPRVGRALTLLSERYLIDALGAKPTDDPEQVAAALLTIWLSVLGSDRAVATRRTS